jgi:2-methylisocitrate lyase-like PEP mutase family enzyme
MFMKDRFFFAFCFLLSSVIRSSPIAATGQNEETMEHLCFSSQLQEKARLFHSLHQTEDLLILPNAWDALSAKIFERQGAKAIATTSAGMAAIFGYADGQQFPKDLLFIMVDRIVKSVTVPVTIDLEAGFGDTPEEICETVLSILKLGAVGINIEDADPKRPGSLFPIAEQAKKIRAIKSLAHKLNVPFFLNARTDVFWLNVGDRETQLQEALARLQAYQEAGADGIFVPGLTDHDLISEVVQKVHLPLNLLAGTWIKDLTTLKPLGVSRITLGSSLTRECAGHSETLVRQYLDGNYTLNPSLSYSMFNSLFQGCRK